MEVDEDIKALWDHFVVGGWDYLIENPETMKSVGIMAAVIVFILFVFTRKKS